MQMKEDGRVIHTFEDYISRGKGGQRCDGCEGVFDYSDLVTTEDGKAFCESCACGRAWTCLHCGRTWSKETSPAVELELKNADIGNYHICEDCVTNEGPLLIRDLSCHGCYKLSLPEYPF